MKIRMQYSSSLILWVMLLTVVAVLFCEPILHWIEGTGWMKMVYANIQPSLTNDICALLILLLSCFLIDNYDTNKSEKSNLLGIVISFPLCVLMLLLRAKHVSDYIPFYQLNDFKYADVPFFITLIFALKCVLKDGRRSDNTKDDNNDTKTGLLFDDSKAIDILGRQASVKTNADLLVQKNNINSKGAIGVAITGSWGSGKSWYMEALKKELENKGQICIDFRPWLYSDKELTTQFCIVLSRALGTDNIESHYLEKLINCLLEASGGISSTLSKLFNSDSNKTREELINDVKTEMSNSERQIFVFMDDCDRLNKTELLQVFSVIRNVCDFPHLCYILSYDPQVISKTLEGNGGLYYVAKMINLNIPLESISNEIITETICKLFSNRLHLYELKTRLNGLDLTLYIPTLRELKRFWNCTFSDLMNQSDKFDKAYFDVTDWIILELIKFKDISFYEKLKNDPDNILRTDNGDWDSPSWVYAEKEADPCKALLLFLFPCHKGYSTDILTEQSVHILYGIRNKAFTPVYFTSSLPKGYRDKREYQNAVSNGHLESHIEKWVRKGDKGLLFILIDSVTRINNFNDVVSCLTKYIWTSCDIKDAIKNISILDQGIDYEEANHSYRFTKAFIANHPQLVHLFILITDEFNNELKKDKTFNDFLTNTDRPLELMGLMMCYIRPLGDKVSSTYQYLRNWIYSLWNRILKEEQGKPIDTINILEILHDSTFEDTFDFMVLPLIISNPKRWLGATITYCKTFEDKTEYLLLKDRETHALFGQQSDTTNLLNRIEEAVNEDDKQYVKEYSSLYNCLAANILYKADNYGILEKYKRPSALEKSHYPHLTSETEFVGSATIMPIDEVIKEMKNNPFWQGDNLRIERNAAPVYIGTNFSD